MMIITNLIRSLVVGVIIVGLAACAKPSFHEAEGSASASFQPSEETAAPARASFQPSQTTVDPAHASLADIMVSFKLDPRLTRGMYMGDRWVSPPTYTSVQQIGKDVIVEARAYGVAAGGNSVSIDPEWKSSNPDMMDISPGQGWQVKITVRKAGQGSLKVAAGGVTKELSVTATEKGDALQVDITQ